MSRNPIVPGDRVFVTLIGEGPQGEPFPHYIEGTVVSIHDDFVAVWDHTGSCRILVKRERVITEDQLSNLRKRFLREE